MDNERIQAARKKLKEFQRNKKEQSNKNTKQCVNFHRQDDQHTSVENLVLTHDDFQNIQYISKLDHNNESFETENINQSSKLYNNTEYVKNISIPNIYEDKVVPNICTDHESNNGISEVLPYNNFIEDHKSGNVSTVSLDNIQDNINPTTHTQNMPIQECDYLSLDSNTCISFQKEHLLQMASAVANVLEGEQSTDESTLSNYDLEQKNQFLTCCLEEQKKMINQLHLQVGQYNSKISELEAIIATKNAEFESRFIRELNPLKEQVQLDAQTIGILVGEKAELIATNSQCQETIKEKTEEVIELTGKLKSTQQQITELERQLSYFKNNIEDLTKTLEQSQKNYEELFENSNKHKKQIEDMELETSELRQKLNYRNTEISSLQQELQEKIALLSLSELQMQQLVNSPHEVNSLETQHHTAKVLEQQLLQMKEALESVSDEKNEVSKKYQSYVQELDEQHTKLLKELEISKKVISESEIREQSYIQRLSELEQQLQKDKAKLIQPVEDQTEKIEVLRKSLDNSVLEQENLQSLLNEKDNEIELLKKELKELQDVREQSLEAYKLATALQSEQLGASRAVSQNQQLKTQLDEMHDAFIALSNTKLDLTEKLQAERSIGKKLNSQLNDLEQQVEELKEQVSKKEEMLIEFEKEKLQAAQIEDQIQHYQAQSHSATTFQQELQKALTINESLKKENKTLRLKLDSVEDAHTTTDNASKNIQEESKSCTLENNISKTKTEILSENSPIPNIPEPMKKLENRFKETMEKVAELTDEKQRLEHLVLQLQGETETIGEYVTLYQKQRSILQEKARKKELTFRQLLDQRNQQQEQLHKLKILVAELLKSKDYCSDISTATAAEENISATNNIIEGASNNVEIVDGHVDKLDESMNKAVETKVQIMNLLTEIKDCNDTCSLEPNFHPCPWCSGKLITV